MVIFFFFLPSFASAAEAYKGLAGENSALSTIEAGNKAATGNDEVTALPTIIGNLVGGILGILGIILVVLIVQAGIMYMTAGGDPGKVDKAKKMITQAVVGMIIVAVAYSITWFVVELISNATK